MIGFIKKLAAKIWAKNHVKQTEYYKNNAEQLQEKLLLDLVKSAEKTLFGLQHNFSEIKSIEDFQQLTTYQQVVDGFVFDTKSINYGGTGKKFDWQLLTNYQLSTPFLLSGGITLEDALILKNFQHPRCIGFDINSGFESAPGIKKTDEVKQFIDTIDGRIEQN